MSMVLRNLLLVVLVSTTALACSRQTAEEKGKELATEKIDIAKGIGDALVEKGGKAAESISHGTGNVLKGAQSGVNKAMAWGVTTGEGLRQAGLEVTQMQPNTTEGQGKNLVDVYLLASQPVKGNLVLIAYDENQKELGRVQHPLSFQAQEGRYETMKLDERTPMRNLTTVFVDFVPEASTAQK